MCECRLLSSFSFLRGVTFRLLGSIKIASRMEKLEGGRGRSLSTAETSFVGGTRESCEHYFSFLSHIFEVKVLDLMIFPLSEIREEREYNIYVRLG